jgi:hypothetical protein
MGAALHWKAGKTWTRTAAALGDGDGMFCCVPTIQTTYVPVPERGRRGGCRMRRRASTPDDVVSVWEGRGAATSAHLTPASAASLAVLAVGFLIARARAGPDPLLLN